MIIQKYLIRILNYFSSPPCSPSRLSPLHSLPLCFFHKTAITSDPHLTLSSSINLSLILTHLPVLSPACTQTCLFLAFSHCFNHSYVLLNSVSLFLHLSLNPSLFISLSLYLSSAYIRIHLFPSPTHSTTLSFSRSRSLSIFLSLSL